MRVRAATRGSALARWQTDHVARLLARAGLVAGVEVEVEPVIVETSGDQRTDVPIWEMGGKGVFVKEVQAAVLDGRADIAVHSAKDMPSVVVDGLAIAAVPQRGDPRDVLVGARLADLAPGATVATGSVRRRAQLAWARPDLTFVGLRGNIATRLEKIPDGGAIVMAVAAIVRLGIDLVDVDHEILSPEMMLPQVGQGTLAIECATAATELRALLAHCEHEPSRRSLDAERGFLAELGGDCDLPAGAYATVADDGTIELEALLADVAGTTVLRHAVTGADGPALGRAAARYLLDDAGGAALLDR